MGQRESRIELYVHAIWATWRRRPLLDPEIEPRIFGAIAEKSDQLKCVLHAIGGTADHVHLLIGMRATHRLADVVRDIKQSSSKWVHEEIGVKKFGWQDGYGAFTVAASQIESVREYINNQVEHHRKRSFQEEYVEFLERSGVEYDKRYLW